MDYYLKQKGSNYWETQNHGWISKTLFWAKEGKHRRLYYITLFILNPKIGKTYLNYRNQKVVASGELELIVMRPKGSFWVVENALYHVLDSDYIGIFNCQNSSKWTFLMCAL